MRQTEFLELFTRSLSVTQYDGVRAQCTQMIPRLASQFDVDSTYSFLPQLFHYPVSAFQGARRQGHMILFALQTGDFGVESTNLHIELLNGRPGQALDPPGRVVRQCGLMIAHFRSSDSQRR